ncbi:unnamed protein product, partial [Mesorhabditis belari]|uniref:Myb-like domain-containing protein n=1 Tax=Mesorhabditis belari TaxID=2138241 RepID=A0AAF3FE12_9BILA
MRRARIAARPNLIKQSKQNQQKLPEESKEDIVIPIISEELPIERPTTLFEGTSIENESSLTSMNVNVSAIFEAATMGYHSSRKVAFHPNEKSDGERLFRFRKFTGEEELDTKTMRMSDLVAWNPKHEQKLERKVTEEALKREIVPKSEKAQPMAPQVIIGPDGKLVLDEKSLLIRETESSEMWGSVDEERLTRHTTSMSFRSRNWRKGTAWTEKETDLFYDILRHTGPDFGLMHEFFPTRARNELKSKYNREERFRWDRINKTLSMPAILNDSLYAQVEQAMNEIRAEELEKRNRKRKPAESNGELRKRYEKVDWDELNADLVAEAEKIIEDLESERAQSKIVPVPVETNNKAREVSNEAKQLLKVAEKLLIPIDNSQPKQGSGTESSPNPAAHLGGYDANKSASPASAQPKKTSKINKEAVRRIEESVKRNKPMNTHVMRNYSTLSNQELLSISASSLQVEIDVQSQVDSLPAPPVDPSIKRPIAIRPMLTPESMSPLLPPISSMLAPLGSSTSETIKESNEYIEVNTAENPDSLSTVTAFKPVIGSTDGPSAFSSLTGILAPKSPIEAANGIVKNTEEILPGPSKSTLSQQVRVRARTISRASTEDSRNDGGEDSMSMGNFDGVTAPKKYQPSKRVTSSHRLWSARFAIPATTEIRPTPSVSTSQEPPKEATPTAPAQPTTSKSTLARPAPKRRENHSQPQPPVAKAIPQKEEIIAKQAEPISPIPSSTEQPATTALKPPTPIKLPDAIQQNTDKAINVSQKQPAKAKVAEMVEKAESPIKAKTTARVFTKAVGGIRLAVHPNASKTLEGAKIRRPGQNKPIAVTVKAEPVKDEKKPEERQFNTPSTSILIDESDEEESLEQPEVQLTRPTLRRNPPKRKSQK